MKKIKQDKVDIMNHQAEKENPLHKLYCGVQREIRVVPNLVRLLKMQQQILADAHPGKIMTYHVLLIERPVGYRFITGGFLDEQDPAPYKKKKSNDICLATQLQEAPAPSFS